MVVPKRDDSDNGSGSGVGSFVKDNKGKLLTIVVLLFVVGGLILDRFQ